MKDYLKLKIYSDCWNPQRHAERSLIVRRPPVGVYNTLLVSCPECGVRNEFQTKSGSCLLQEVKIEEADFDDLYDANRHSPVTCSNCKCSYYVDREKRIGTREKQ